MTTPAASRISRARAALLMEPETAFFGTLALSLEILPGGPDCDTMQTDGRALFYNESFVMTLTDDELRGVVAHEVLHCALGHHVRRNGRDLAQWNRACDLAVNPILKENGRLTLPAGHLDESRFHGMGAEDIFAALGRENPPPPPPPSQGGEEEESGQGAPQPGAPAPGPGKPGPGKPGNDPGACGGIIDAAPAHDKAALAEAAADMDSKVAGALSVSAARNAGKIPGGLQRVAEDHGRARVDWRETLRRFIDQSNVKDYAWTRPNRRFISAGLILPGLVSDSLRELVLCVDTSGSIDRPALEAFRAEINAALSEGAADSVTVVYCDSAVQRVDSFGPGEPLEFKPPGGGGTAFAPAFEHVRENCQPSAVIYFTDLESDDFGEEPGVPVLWAGFGNAKRFAKLGESVPFGEALYLGD